MLEPQEIDALLISALYGELTPAEESRLQAHLGSHPADKTALAALTSTRDAVRASRILQVQLDPPQSVSALLLQEAARRAPKPQEKEGWFARLARSFMAHPAMAAAAMLVVVIGLATLVQNRKGDHFADSSAPSQPQLNESKPSATDGIVANQPAPTAATSKTEALDQGAAGGERANAGSASGGDNDRYSVTLADGEARDRQALEKSKLAVDAKNDEVDRRKRVTESPKADPAPDTTRDETIAANKKGKATKPVGGYMELRSPEEEPSVKEFEGNSNAESAPGQAYATVPADDSGKQQVNAVTPGRSLGANGTGAATTPPRGGDAAPTTKSPPKATTSAKIETKPAPKPAENQVARNVDPAGPRTQAPAAPPPPPPSTGSKAAEEKDKNVNDPQLAWAREQHTTIIARVKGGDCKGAATIAVGLANRDLAYYKQNVASDRSVRECLAYIDNAREKDQEQRAERSKATQKRAMNEPAAAPAKKAEPTKNADTSTK